MSKALETIMQLIDPSLPASRRQLALREFANENDWLPSDEITEYSGTEKFSNGHLVIEHGLDNTAVISFLKSNRPFQYLSSEEKLCLLSISYNNLVEWHLLPDSHGLTVIFNRTKPLTVEFISTSTQENIWRAEAFDTIIGRKPNPNIRSLDDALIKTISFWKRVLAAELGNKVTNENISSLFNAILFARALEDYRKHHKSNNNESQLLINIWENLKTKSLRTCITRAIKVSSNTNVQRNLVNETKLTVFDSLDNNFVYDLLKDFYINKFAPYPYDFSLMSKHALSRIYEHYVSLFREEESPQMTLFPDLPEEVNKHEDGAIYTPQYIARFFSRYLKENLTPSAFRNIKIADPSCGSGIFLRTMLEMQCDPLQEIDMREPTSIAFQNVLGLDIDENACQATRLSLNLLHLVLRGDFPQKLNVINIDSIKYFIENSKYNKTFDAVITNPPFVKWDKLNQQQRETLTLFMRKKSKGKIDLYLALLKIGMAATNPGGYLLYILPHTFLRSNNAHVIRKEIYSDFWIRFVADLSEIPVFEKIGSYVILLILQRKSPELVSHRHTTIVRCREAPGKALQTALEGKTAYTDMFDVFNVNQLAFKDDSWSILSPKQMDVKIKISELPTLDQFLVIKEGFITGADDVFIRKTSEIPEGERKAYIPYLSDRKMEKYKTLVKTNEYVFYPFLDNKKLTESEVKRLYPKTWKYLRSNSERLKSRRSAISNPWWSPVRPRAPKDMLVPKIVSPHLVLLPKFSLDLTGKYGISRCPLMYPKYSDGSLDILYYFLGIMNSSIVFWQISNVSDKYSRGYFMLEPKTLRRIHVPDPSLISPLFLKTLQHIVKKQIDLPRQRNEQKIDSVVADIYGLSADERIQIGMGDLNANN